MAIGNTQEKDRDAATRNGAVHWHTDGSYKIEPTTVTMLYARVAPKLGGETLFNDMVAAYKALEPRQQKLAESRTAKHFFGAAKLSPGQYPVTPIKTDKQAKAVPPVVKPRVMRVLPRGDWMDESGEIVEPAIPAFLGKLDTGDKRPTRLDLANWFVSADNPMTSRTFVNHLWHMFFGAGISNVLADLGNQGEPPVHPELLDWLARRFVESGWSVKAMHRLVMLSATYRQDSQHPELDIMAKRDPAVRYLWRAKVRRPPRDRHGVV